MKYFIIIIMLQLIFVSCKKEEEPTLYEPVDKETHFDLRGQWQLKSAYMYFDLENISNQKLYKKKNHFGGGRTESILVDGRASVYPIEYIMKDDIWEFRNSTLRIYRADGSDTLIVNLNNYTPTFQYQTNPETVINDVNGINAGNGINTGNGIPYQYTKYFYHTLGKYGDERPIEIVLKHDGSISLIMISQYAPSYKQGEFDIGWAVNELEFTKIN